MDIIKQEYFSERNINMIFEIISNEFVEIKEYRSNIWKCQNVIYNNFIESAHYKSFSIEQIEEALIALNKLTIIQIKELQKLTQLTPQLTPHLTPHLTPQLTPQITQQITPQITSHITSHITPQLTTQIIPQLTTQIIPQLTTQIIPQLTTQIIPQLTTQIIPQIIPQITSQLTPQITREVIYEPTVIRKHANLFSGDCIILNGQESQKYIFDFKSNIETFKIKTLSLFNNLYNIMEYNNTLELDSQSIKIPIGNYNIYDLIDILNEKVKGMFTFIYNKNKDRISIKSDKRFNIKFRETNPDIIQLKTILGFSKTEYSNNNNYTSDSNINLNIYDTLYLKIIECEKLNVYKCKNFNYACELNFDSIITFTKKIFIKFDLNDIKFDKLEYHDKLSIEFYYKLQEKFFKVPSLLTFNILIEYS